MSITIKELIDRAAEVSGSTKRVAEATVEAVFDEITNALKEGQEVTIRNFGRFYSKQRDAREGRNPKTGEAIHIEEKTVIKFVPRGEMKAGL